MLTSATIRKYECFLLEMLKNVGDFPKLDFKKIGERINQI